MPRGAGARRLAAVTALLATALVPASAGAAVDFTQPARVGGDISPNHLGVAATTDGGLTVAWSECPTGDGCHGMRAIERSPAGVWGEVTVLGQSTPSSYEQYGRTQVRADAEGGAHVGWYRWAGGASMSPTQYLEAAYRPAGGQWASSQAHSSPLASERFEFFAWGGGFRAFSDYVRDGGTSDRHVVIDGSAAGWGAPVGSTLPNHQTYYGHPDETMSAVNLAGDQVLVAEAFVSNDVPYAKLVLARTGTGSWTEPLKLNPSETGAHASVSDYLVDVNEGGDAAVLWGEGGEAGIRHFLRVRDGAQGAWSEPVAVDTEFSAHDLVLDGAGRVYLSGTAINADARVLEYAPSTGFRAVTLGPTIAYPPLVDADEGGRVVALWSARARTEDPFTVYAATRAASGEWSPAKAVGVDLFPVDAVVGPGGVVTLLMSKACQHTCLYESRARFDSGGGAPGGGAPVGGGAPGGGQPKPFPYPFAARETTVRTAPMPNVVGRPLVAARGKLLDDVPNMSIQVDFTRRCKQSAFLDVVKQNPAPGTRMHSSDVTGATAQIDVCVPDRSFMKDCTGRDLDRDLRKLPRKVDMELANELVFRLAKCKVDYDISLVKKNREAAVRLDDQTGKKGQKEIRAALECSTAPGEQNLRVALGEGYFDGVKNTSWALSDRGSKWALPATARSFVEIQVLDRAMGMPRAAVYVDADDVFPRKKDVNVAPGTVFTTDGGGHARLKIAPVKPGRINICVVQQLGDEDSLTWAGSIDVVKPPRPGEIWETVNGRQIRKTKVAGQGELVEPDAGGARAAGLGEIWDAIVSLFSGRSRTVNEVDTKKKTPKKRKPAIVSRQAKVSVGQVSLDGRLHGNPKVPKLVQGPCLTIEPNATATLFQCPTLVAEDGAALVTMDANGKPLIGLGHHNVAQKLIGPDGATLRGNGGNKVIVKNGGNIISTNGGGLLRNSTATLIGADGATLIGPDGATLIGPDGATVTGALGGNAIAPGISQMVAAGAGNIVAAGAGNMVPPGGLD